MFQDKVYDFAVAGAGIVGLATAFYILDQYPQASLAVLEKEKYIARHQTGRNSGVIHSGIYYRPGSFKAENTREGYKLLLDFLQRYNLPYRISGKLIVATEPDETDYLEQLYRNGRENGLENLRLLSGDQIKDYEPHIEGIAAIHVPQTGVTDYRSVSRQLAEIIRQKGGEIFLQTHVKKITPGHPAEIETEQGSLRAKNVVVAAGLYTDKLYGHSSYRIIPFRGEYYYLKSPWDRRIRSMVYPVPDPRYPFLGIHLTRHLDNRVSAGPSAVLALGREAYRKTDWDAKEIKEMLLFPGFRALAKQHAVTGLQEWCASLCKPVFAKRVRKFLPDIPTDALTGFHSGIRAQLVDREGRLVDDFVIQTRENVIYILNAPSPAATASLAIGRQVADAIV